MDSLGGDTLRDKLKCSGLLWPLNQLGQMSIFFATSMLLIITIIAFIVNIGTFVKAKINLQNAVDAAAYAGAAVQSRQLTNMAYLNWEMRNTYKEWMFKYYVLGGMGVDDVAQGPAATGQSPMDFRADSANFGTVTGTDIYGTRTDYFNFPSICINFADTGSAGSGNNCSIFNVPGLPDFSAQSVSVGIDNTTTAFINTIATQKANNCANLTAANFLAANLWAYNVYTDAGEASEIAAIAPNILADRMGAWPRAFELAIRMRNLEYQMNRAPYSTGVCSSSASASIAGINCAQESAQISGLQRASDERVLKAYISGFRNLGNDVDSEMKSSFTLFEIPPKSFTPQPRSLSDQLSKENYEKFYVDLKLVPLNLTTFFTLFQTSSGAMANNVQSSVNCTQTKVGLPIPGYPLGFVKNPEVLTYYAVKGEAGFIGLFNPFNKMIKLTAYAAAKPFGGRIGPNLFNTKSNQSVTSRGDVYRSGSYISGFDVASVTTDSKGDPLGSKKNAPGIPIPLNPTTGTFWVEDVDDVIGGAYFDPDKIVFAIPNLVYDYVAGDMTGGAYQPGGDKLQILASAPPPNTSQTAGLYNSDMFQKFRANMAFTNTYTPDVFF
jgi:hypothetical protein